MQLHTAEIVQREHDIHFRTALYELAIETALRELPHGSASANGLSLWETPEGMEMVEKLPCGVTLAIHANNNGISGDRTLPGQTEPCAQLDCETLIDKLWKFAPLVGVEFILPKAS